MIFTLDNNEVFLCLTTSMCSPDSTPFGKALQTQQSHPAFPRGASDNLPVLCFCLGGMFWSKLLMSHGTAATPSHPVERQAKSCGFSSLIARKVGREEQEPCMGTGRRGVGSSKTPWCARGRALKQQHRLWDNPCCHD